jgi:methylated-DNA-[protein]-cysteine S-methyltransferase
MDETAYTRAPAFALFETALGMCGVAWHDTGITAVALPAPDPGRTRARMRRVAEGPESPPPAEVERGCSLIAALLDGEAVDLTAVEVADADLPEFDRRVYAIARGIRPGETLTYGDVARRLGDPALARDVGAALGRNPTPIVVPCHRVVAADGSLGGFSAPGGRETKRRLLALERAHSRELNLFA